MSSVRKKLSASELNALAATPLPFEVIWAESDFEAFLQKAESDQTHVYLEFLRRYKATLSESNPAYNAGGLPPLKAELLRAIGEYGLALPDDEVAMIAATKNLYAVLQRDVKNYQAAILALENALILENLAPLSRASLLHNLTVTHTLRKDYRSALKTQEQAVKCLEEMEFSSEIEKHVAASIYSVLGNIYRKAGLDAESVAAFTKALELWKSNVMVNRAAINHLKLGTKADYEAAEKLLTPCYEAAKANNRVVTLYYLTDAYIKLAGHARDTAQYDEYREKANECLALTKCAIATYKEANYIKKMNARIHYLEANFAYLEGRVADVTLHAEAAAKEREGVHENAEGKLQKFLAKFPPANGLFDAKHLVRQRTQEAKPETPALPVRMMRV